MAEIKKTSDGSSTIFVEELNEHYHSVHGAYNEAMHVFIEAGLRPLKEKVIKVFEVGFGTGLNAHLTHIESEQKDLNIEYHSIEKYPVDPKIIAQLNYGSITNQMEKYHQINQAEWNQSVVISKNFSIFKYSTDLKSFETDLLFDLIYFDAFAPDKQPGLWTDEIFAKMFLMLSPGGVLVTYCAKGIIRRRMVEQGFLVERIPGPPGKREMLRATKKRSHVSI